MSNSAAAQAKKRGLLDSDLANQVLNKGEAIQEIPDSYNWRIPQGIDWTKALVVLVPPPPTLIELKSDAKKRTAQRRWEIETGGISLNGSGIATDDRSKLLLSSAADQARADATFSAKWKTADGSWITLDAATILTIYGAVFAHVRACFAREAVICGLIDNAASPDDVAWLAPAITAFWPAP